MIPLSPTFFCCLLETSLALARLVFISSVITKLWEANAVLLTTQGGAKSWHGRSFKKTHQRTSLFDGCYDGWVSGDLPEWDSQSNIIKETTLTHCGGANSSK